MRKPYVSKNGLTPQINRDVGKLLYVLVYGTIFFIAFKIWGIDVLDDIWFWAFNATAYFSVGWFLRKIGFWVY